MANLINIHLNKFNGRRTGTYDVCANKEKVIS